MFSDATENGIALLQDCLLEGRSAESATFCLAENLAITPNGEGVRVASPDARIACRLNATAALILSYCTGDHTLSEIDKQVSPFLRPAWVRLDAKLLLLTTLWQLRALNLIRIASPASPCPSPARLETPLREVHLFLTTRCPLKCVHCCITHNQSQEMPTRQMIDLLHQLAYLGLPHLTLTGGEPLLREDLFEIAEEARASGLAFDLATSGITLDGAAATRLARLAPQNVNISIYSAEPEVHDRITGVPGSWRRSLATIRRLAELGVPVTLKCMIMSLNYASYAGVADLAEGLGQHYVFDPGLTCRLDGCRAPLRYRITPMQLEEFARTHFWHQSTGPALDESDRPCHAGSGRCAVGANGAVYPCVLFPLPLGSVLERPLREVLAGEATEQLHGLRVRDMGHCAACDQLRHCVPCPGLAFLEHGDYLRSPGWCCVTARAQCAALAHNK